VNRQTRKQLKTDKFAEEVGQGFSFVSSLLTEHRTEVIRYGLIAIAVIVIGAGYYFYSSSQAAKREDALEAARKIDGASVGPTAPPNGGPHFATQEEKDKARAAAFADLYTKYRGTTEGSVGGIFTAAAKADKGDFAAAEKIYQDIIDSAPKDYVSLAQMSLAECYAAQGKTQDAEKILRDLIAHPTALVSAEEAKLELADIMAPTNPKEAIALVQPLTGMRTVISKAAIKELGKIQANNPQP